MSDKQAIDKALTKFSVEVECAECEGVGKTATYKGPTKDNVMKVDNIVRHKCPTCNGTGKRTSYPFALHLCKHDRGFYYGDFTRTCKVCHMVDKGFGFDNITNPTFYSKDGWWRLIDGLREMGRLDEFIDWLLPGLSALAVGNIVNLLNPQEVPALVAEFLGLEVE